MTGLATEMLVRARELIADPDDWAQGPRVAVCGKHCMITALAADLDAFDADFDDALDAYYAAKLRLRAEIGDQLISDWNDAPGRTHAQVLAAFDRAIAAAADGAADEAYDRCEDC